MASLIRFKIPIGFAVCYNNFMDVDPISFDENNFLEQPYFTEDILQIVKMEIQDGKWIIPQENNLIIDLGWYPDSRAYGNYRLILVNNEWEELLRKESKDKFEIRDTLEEWMERINRGLIKPNKQ